MSDFTDPNGQIPFDTGNTDVPRTSRSEQSDSSVQASSAQQYMQHQPYGQPYDQPYQQQPIQSQPAQSQSAQSQPVPPQPMQPDYGQASPSAQYGQPAYSQTPRYAPQAQYAQMPQYGQQQPQYDRTQPDYGQAQSQYNQAQPQYGQPYTQQYGQYGQYGQQQTGYDQQAYRQMPSYQTAPQPAYGGQQKSKLAAGLFGIFLGALGVHNFYLGFTGKAIAQLLLSLIGWVLFGLGPVVAGIWGLVEGILILCSTYGSNWHRDAKGIELTD